MRVSAAILSVVQIQKTETLLYVNVLSRIRMTLTEYFSTEPRGAKLEMAEHLGITPTWLFLIMTGRKRPSPLLCVKIEEATQGLITKKELRPDLFS